MLNYYLLSLSSVLNEYLLLLKIMQIKNPVLPNTLMKRHTLKLLESEYEIYPYP